MKTALQQFSEEITADYLGVPANTVAECCSGEELTQGDLAIDISTITTFVEMIMTIVKTLQDNCNPSKAQLKAAAKAPTFIQRAGLRMITARVTRQVNEGQWSGDSWTISSHLLGKAARTEDAQLERIATELIPSPSNWLL